MSSRPYNGFSPEQRQRAGNWLKRQVAAGRLQPKSCDACGQTKGVLDAHSEDYSEPFGPHIGKFGLCYRCHMILHCRHRSEAAWSRYRDEIRAGWQYAPCYTRNFNTITEWLDGVPQIKSRPFRPRKGTVLDEIHAGLHAPALREPVPAPDQLGLF